jgi:ribose transport system ATP-binding protein
MDASAVLTAPQSAAALAGRAGPCAAIDANPSADVSGGHARDHSPRPADGKALIELSRICKSFGGARALDEVDLKVTAGSIHGLVGQNGAGKSTLIKILAGLHGVDSGTIRFDGEEYPRLTPQLAARLGIQFIHQDRLLVPAFTVGEALFLGREPRIGRSPLLDRSALRRGADRLMQRYFGISLPHDALISELTTAEKQILQITRALMASPKVLVFDEPTAALVRREIDILFQLIRRLRDDGVTILYISHYLGEIEDLCDTITVLRNGRLAARLAREQTSAAEIARLMVARDLDELYPRRQVQLGEEILSVEQLSRRGSYQDISFSLRRGEVLGMTGLLGSGAKELVRTLFGLDQPDSGRMHLHGVELSGHSVAGAVAAGLALVPEDRRRQGVALNLTLRENATLASLARFTRAGLVNRRRERAEARALIERLQIKTHSPEALVATLSGGNQQKVALAKWLGRQSDIYILDEPTVGVDIGAKVEIYNLIGELAARGAGVLILSSDLTELLGMTDRILVVFRGRISNEVLPTETSADALLADVTGSGEAIRHVD